MKAEFKVYDRNSWQEDGSPVIDESFESDDCVEIFKQILIWENEVGKLRPTDFDIEIDGISYGEWLHSDEISDEWEEFDKEGFQLVLVDLDAFMDGADGIEIDGDKITVLNMNGEIYCSEQPFIPIPEKYKGKGIKKNEHTEFCGMPSSIS